MTEQLSTPHDRVHPLTVGSPADQAGDPASRDDAVEALRASEARYRALVEASTRMVWLTDAAGMVEDMPYWRRLTGQTVEQVRGAGWLDALHPDDRARVAASWQRAYHTRTVYEADYRLRHADGSYRWYRARGAPVLDAGGRIVEWVGVFNDIDDERRQLTARRLLERASEALVSASGVREALAAVARIAIAPVDGADAFADGIAIDVPRAPQAGGGFDRVAVESHDPVRTAVVHEIERLYPTPADAPVGYAHAIRTGESQLIADIDSEVVTRLAADERHATLLRALGMYSSIVVPLRARGATLGAMTFVLAGPERRRQYDAADLAVAEELARRAALALDNAQRYEAEQASAQRARRAEQASAFLAEASALLAESLEYETTLRTLAEATVPRLADWCTVDMVVDPTAGEWPPRLERMAAAHRDAAMLAIGSELEEKYPGDRSEGDPRATALRDGRPMLVPVVTDEALRARARDEEHLRLLRALRFSSVMIVPMVARGLTLGVLTLCHTESGRRYDPADLALAEDLAHRAAVAVDNARLFRAAEQAREDAEQARLRAEEANLAKSQFLSTMSHELRTPLNAITGYVDLLDMGLRGPVTEVQREDLNRIRRGAKVLMSLVNDVLNFARLEAGQVEVHLRAVRVGDVLGGLQAIVAPQVQAKRLAFRCEAADDVTAFADAERVEQVLTNLLTNAIKFTPPGGSVTVTAGRDDGAAEGAEARVWVRVADTGRGIAEDQLGVIFEPFVQVDRHLTHESQQGVGLGLAISRDLARLMGGDLTVESRVGQGSAFTLVLRAA